MDLKIDSEVLESYGTAILDSISIYKETIEQLYSLINNMPNKTFEWVGVGAVKYVNKFNEDYKFFLDINDLFVKYGQFLLDYSNEMETLSKRYE